MECKFNGFKAPITSIVGNSNTILECKLRCGLTRICYMFVIVTPYWNVNDYKIVDKNNILIVIVTPYWNVNTNYFSSKQNDRV